MLPLLHATVLVLGLDYEGSSRFAPSSPTLMRGMRLVAPAPAYSNMIEDRHMHLGGSTHLQQSASLGHRSCHRHFGSLLTKLYLNYWSLEETRTPNKMLSAVMDKNRAARAACGGG
jgi:hypothetical protein